MQRLDAGDDTVTGVNTTRSGELRPIKDDNSIAVDMEIEMPFENPTDYVGNLVYKNGVLDKILIDGGYISGSDRNYHFFVTDHLGNVRVVATTAGVIEQQNEFSPYGESIDTDTQFTSENPYKWSGKEWDEEQGAYDFGARMYAPTDARWSTMDPLCEKYYHISPYAYCAGNPVNLVDPDGMQWYSYEDDKGNKKYTYCEGEMSDEDKAKYKNLQYLGYTYLDETNNMYYSLFGNSVPIKDENGSKLNSKLYQHLDKLFIRAYGGDEPDGVGSENFFEPEAVGREYIDFTYDGKNFKSIAGWFEVFDNKENSTGCIAAVPNSKNIITGGSSNSPGWRKNCGVGGAFATRTLPAGCYLQVHRKGANGNIHMIDVVYKPAEADKFATARAKLFPSKY